VDSPLTSEDLPPEVSVRTDVDESALEPVAVELESTGGGATDLQVRSHESQFTHPVEPEESEPAADREL
ncbi:MAG TPA: hypothetical protein VGW96_04410, partial [Candidatus Eremiobacteraceae bacterium]|nr:hypothetical protein [Candidatus Eremiobacteraceae bacterium]